MSINTIFQPRIDILYIALALISFIMRKMAICNNSSRLYEIQLAQEGTTSPYYDQNMY